MNLREYQKHCLSVDGVEQNEPLNLNSALQEAGIDFEEVRRSYRQSSKSALAGFASTADLEPIFSLQLLVQCLSSEDKQIQELGKELLDELELPELDEIATANEEAKSEFAERAMQHQG